MAAISGTGEHARNLAKALGLDPTKTKRIILNIEADEIVTVDVVQYVQKEDLDMLILELKRFELHEPEKDV